MGDGNIMSGDCWPGSGEGDDGPTVRSREGASEGGGGGEVDVCLRGGMGAYGVFAREASKYHTITIEATTRMRPN